MTKAPLDRDIYPLSFAHIHPITFATLPIPPAPTSILPPFLSTDLSMLKPPRQWLDLVPLNSLVALICWPWALLDACISSCRGPACFIYARSSDISRSKTCFAFPPACYCINFVSFPTMSFTPSSRTPLVHLGLDC